MTIFDPINIRNYILAHGVNFITHQVNNLFWAQGTNDTAHWAVMEAYCAAYNIVPCTASGVIAHTLESLNINLP